MHERGIIRLDRAAVTLLQALDEYGDDLKPYLDPCHLETLTEQVVNLRRVLLGLEMGVLYQDWEVPADVIERVIKKQPSASVEQAAEQAHGLLGDCSEPAEE